MIARGNFTTPSIVVRANNFSIATARFMQTWRAGVPAAAGRRFMRLWPLWLGGCLLVILCALVLDAPSVDWARGLPAPFSEFFQWLTRYGKSDWLLLPLGIFCLVLLIADWRNVNRRIAAAWSEIGIIVGFAFLSIAGSGILVNVFKQLIGRGRPRVFDQDGAFSFVPFQFDYAHVSFPSGHSTTAGALAVVILVLAPRFRALALVLAGLVAMSRVVVGAHYPSDVVAGLLLGAGYTWFFALALGVAGIGFKLSPAGPIRARIGVARRVFWRPRGLLIAMSSLWFAIIGRGRRGASG